MLKKILNQYVFKHMTGLTTQIMPNFSKFINRLRVIASLGVLSLLCFVTADMAQVSGVAVVKGWNLLGNGTATAIAPSSIGDKNTVTEVDPEFWTILGQQFKLCSIKGERYEQNKETGFTFGRI